MTKSNGKGAGIVIKKYANRRLYDTSTSQYVTLDYLRDLVKKGTDFQVVDAKSGDDLTRGVLAQIIFEEESRGANLLPVDFLRQLIGFYGDSLQSVVPGYLQMSMNSFSQQQEEFRDKMSEAMSSPQATMAMLEEQTRRNMELFGQTMRMFTPFQAGAASGATTSADSKETDSPDSKPEDLSALREELDSLRAKMDQLLDKK
ncbi:MULTISPECIES: polyhydroxyalkanoate synthesis repressor PhaR [Maricaulis]|uniref:Polyhydroxyalkanoate synthesis repressor PhaR n=1 Tax=Maricaulis maris TaxID=74318 RepID=A0A495CY60_9PROT|nr:MULTISPECIES: polyhydroxyalkanoate synthesis repressor PhaR [Maricaulis]RKQ94215.1 polyhydroxyalkanoate synthesis repressor PhaR [Maricaulis maris]